MTIYFAGSIRGGRGDACLYREIISHLKTYGMVLTEHIGNSSLGGSGEEDQTDSFIHDRDMDWILGADIVVTEVSTPSLGVGYEIGRAVEHGKPILSLFRSQEGKRLSAMIAGSPGITCVSYETAGEALKKIDEFFRNRPS